MATAGNQPQRLNASSTGPDRWERVKTIFVSALELKPADRPLFLAAECGADTELRREVESLLDSHEGAGDFIEEPPSALKTLLTDDTATVHLDAGTRIGAYQLVREIGRGGMGAVYLAVRADEEFQKRVAIKLIRPGMESEFVVRRFRNERQILARLEHANIARLIDGGTTSEGLPYFIMEYVEGIPITEYCESNQVPQPQRLELFIKVCAAVQYAHERNIIHRDLKPNNVLIKKDGNPKLLDFGIAKVLGADEGDRKLETTLMGIRLMTPAYASPEQLRGDPATCLSDVYSLGVLLFEVLHGRRPNDTPAAAVSTPSGLRNIVNRAIQSDPAARYPSVADLALDLRRHLAGEAISAPHMSVAVLPFRLLSSDIDTDEYLGLAMADSLITKLSNMRRVTVRSTRSIAKTGDMDPIAAGADLAVDCVLEGYIRRSGDRVRMTVQLVSVRERSPIWAAQFDERFDDLLMLEDRLSGQVAHALLPQFSGEEQRALSKRHTASPKAHQAYLKGRWHWSAYTEESLPKALVAFSEAISEDPQYADAHAGIADYYIWLGMRGGMPASESFAAARFYAGKAVELDPSLAEGHASLGCALWAYERDSSAAEYQLKRAIHLNANLGRAHQWLGMLHSSLGRHEQAAAALERARETDPECPLFASVHALCLYNAREYGRALELLDRLRPSESQSAHVNEIRALCHLERREVEVAVEYARSAVELSGRGSSALSALACTLADSGDQDGARKILGELKTLAKGRYISGYHLAVAELALGNRKECLHQLERAHKSHDWWVLWAGVQPRFDGLRQDARFPAPVGPMPAKRRVLSKRGIVAAVATVGLLAVAWLGFLLLRPQTPPFQDFALTKLTTNGVATHAAISSDGKYVAYGANDRGREALWLRQTNSANAVRITPPMDASLTRIAFAADGGSVSFVAVRHNDTGHAILYQVPVLGGSLKELARDIAGPVSLSPDGARIASIRANPARRRDDLFVVNADGSGERLLATRMYPDRFSWPSTPAWSHDGKRILCAVEGSDAQGYYVSVESVDVANGNVRGLRARRWQFVEQAAWLANDKAVAVIGQEKDASFQHIWYLPYPSGPARQINNDLADYTGLTATSDAAHMVSVQVQTLTNVYVAKPGEPAMGVQVTPGSGRYFDLKWSPQGGIVYASDASGSAELWMMNADGSGQRQLTGGLGRHYAPDVSPTDGFVLFHSNRSGNWNIWRMNLDGGGWQQLTFGKQDSNWPEITPDGKWVVYHHTGGEAKWSIWKVPAAGGEPVQLSNMLTTRPAVSRKNGLITCWYSADAAKPRWQIAVFTQEGGQPIRIFDIPHSVSPDTTLRWTSDGKAITYIDNASGAANLRLQPLDGGSSRQLTTFEWGQIYSFDWSPDGRLAYSRGLTTSDVVMLKDTQ
ncbi:MAG: serine/threonine protein kinase with repeat [Bryobacterales bacterium]|nr:serine/threonine protein kinase with repeat [Bryobacterales bacterium]